jgi:hypothetical protein
LHFCQHTDGPADIALTVLFVKPQVDTGAQLLAMLYLVLQYVVPQLFAGAATGPLLLPAAATAAAAALLRAFDPAR